MIKRTKSAKVDFQMANLPATRKEVFADVLKIHWKSFLGFAFLFVLFTIPFHALKIYEDIIQMNMMQDFDNMTVDQKQAVIVQVLSVKNMSAVLNIVSFIIFSVFLSGMLRIIRQYSWEENVFFGFDMMQGIKQNIGQIFPLFVLVGIVNAFVVYAYNYSILTPNGTLAILLAMAVCAVVIIGLPTLAYTLVSVSLYNNSLIGHIKLGAVMAFKTPFKSFAMLALFFLPFSLTMIPNIVCHIIGGLIGSFCLPVVLLAWYLFAFDRFDEFVNKTKFPELVGKGTFSNNDN
ncbi:MAG: hypothetical protein J6S23_08755 [Clostridia bacterium]|nr:hypothetical protein [Clostridia bacterium]